MIFAPLLGILHCARGRGVLPRWAMFALAGVTAAVCSASLILGLVVALGLAAWLSAGHGNGLITATGRDTRDPDECPLLYQITQRVVPHPDTPDRLRLWGACFMALRGTWLYPLFAGLAAVTWSPLPLALGLLTPLQGLAYYACGKLLPERHAVAASEFIWGTLLGSLIVAAA